MLSDKEHDVVITIQANRTEDVSTGKVVRESKTYIITDRYSDNELAQLVSTLTPVADSTI